MPDAYDMRRGPLVPYENVSGITINWFPGQDDAAEALFKAIGDEGISKGTTGMLFHSLPIGPNKYIVTDKTTPMQIMVGEKPVWYR